MIKISVIVPVYNVEKYLEKCLDSLINQTLKNIEIIVVNDGTKDNSQEIIDKYAKKYRFVKSYIKENGGLSSARNYGLKYAQGEYISFVDSDDWIDTSMLEKMYNTAIKNDSDIVVCDTNIVFDKKNITLNSNLNYSKDNIKNYIISHPMACTRIYKKELFDNDFLFKENIYYEDLQLTPTFAIKTNRISFVNEPLYNYFQRDGSIMKQPEFNKKLLDIFSDLNDVKEKFIKYNKYNMYKNEIEYLYIIHLLRSASIRFAMYKNSKKHLNNIVDTINKQFPNWNENEYYKKSSIKTKIICKITYNKWFILLKLISNMKHFA